MVMTSFNAGTDTPSLPVNALTVVPFSTGTLVVIAVRLFCFPFSVVVRLVLPRTIVGAVTVPVPPSSMIFELSRPSCWAVGLQVTVFPLVGVGMSVAPGSHLTAPDTVSPFKTARSTQLCFGAQFVFWKVMRVKLPWAVANEEFAVGSSYYRAPKESNGIPSVADTLLPLESMVFAGVYLRTFPLVGQSML